MPPTTLPTVQMDALMHQTSDATTTINTGWRLIRRRVVTIHFAPVDLVERVCEMRQDGLVNGLEV